MHEGLEETSLHLRVVHYAVGLGLLYFLFRFFGIPVIFDRRPFLTNQNLLRISPYLPLSFLSLSFSLYFPSVIPAGAIKGKGQEHAPHGQMKDWCGIHRQIC